MLSGNLSMSERVERPDVCAMGAWRVDDVCGRSTKLRCSEGIGW